MDHGKEQVLKQELLFLLNSSKTIELREFIKSSKIHVLLNNRKKKKKKPWDIKQDIQTTEDEKTDENS